MGSKKKPLILSISTRKTNMTSPSLMPTYYSSASRPQPHRYISLDFPSEVALIPDASSTREYSGYVGFSGRGSIGVLCRKGERKSDFTPSVERQYSPNSVEYLSVNADGDFYTVRVSLLATPSPSYLVKSFNPSQTLEWMSNFKIRQAYRRSLEASDPDARRRRICSRLTSRGIRTINDVCSLLVYKHGQRNLGFYTLTCPYSASADIQCFNDCFPEIIRRFMQEIKRAYAARNCTFGYVGVYEIQPERFIRTGDKCLHFHYVARATDSRGGFLLRHEQLVSLYRRVVEAVCSSPLNHSPRIDAQLVRSNCAGYLSKYFSKGERPTPPGVPTGADCTLSSWYSVSRTLLAAAKRARTQLPGHINDYIFRCSVQGAPCEYCKYLRPIYKIIDGFEFCCGCIFTLCDDFLSILQRLKFPDVAHLV